MSGSPTETPLSAKVTLLPSSSFRADDILRSKLSTQESTIPPDFHSLPPKFPSDKEPPITMSPSLPQIRPPAFSPLVNINHITPFEHNKKPLFRARQASEPPPTLDVKAARAPSPPSQVLSPSRQKPVPKAQSASPVVYNPLSSYSWDSWAKPVFVRGPGFLDTPAKNGSILENKQSQPQDPYPPAPPPILYYDPFLGQYVATSGYHTVRRYSQTLGRRQPSRRQHQRHRSVGHYSTCRGNRSTSCLSTYALDSMSERQYPLDEHLIGNVVPYQQAQAPIPRSVTPQRTAPLRPNYRNESEMRLDKKTYLVSSGTDDIPIQLVDTLSPRKQSYNFNSIKSDNADPLESISPNYIPPTMVVSRPSTIPVKSSDDPIRYTSDVVRSLNRRTFKMGQRQSKEGALSPRDHYLEVINGPSHPRVSEKYVFPSSSLNGGERRPGVMDLVKKYSQYEEAAYEPQIRSPGRVMDSRNNVEDFAAISSNMSYNEAMARKPYTR